MKKIILFGLLVVLMSFSVSAYGYLPHNYWQQTYKSCVINFAQGYGRLTRTSVCTEQPMPEQRVVQAYPWKTYQNPHQYYDYSAGNRPVSKEIRFTNRKLQARDSVIYHQGTPRIRDRVFQPYGFHSGKPATFTGMLP